MRANDWKKFLRLSAPDRVLFLKSAALVASLEVAFRCVGVRRACALAAFWTLRPVRGRGSEDGGGRARRIAWLVRAAARRIPGSRCLDRSLATVLMLRREGIGAELVLGVRRSTASPIEAHAWVELSGHPLGEGDALGTYATFDADRVREGLLAAR